MKQSCGNCKYFYIEGNDQVCRFNPPHTQIIFTPPQPPLMKPQQARLSFHPPVSANMWCGKWDKMPDVMNPGSAPHSKLASASPEGSA